MSDNQSSLTPADKKSQLSKLLNRARQLAPKPKQGGAQFVYHSAWVGLLGLSFIDPNLLSNPLATVIFGGLGVEVMGDIISKLVNEPDDDKFITQLEEIIAQTKIEQALSRDDLRAELMAVSGGIGTAIEIAVQNGNVRVARILVRETDRVLDEVRQSRDAVLDKLDDLVQKVDALSGPLQAIDITAPVAPSHIKIFVSSPGDVPQERKIAQEVIDSLRYDPMLQDKVYFDVVAWDKPGASTPMLATMTPQEAINQGLAKPSDCDIVVVIFWSRMGTPLPHPEYQKADGSQYLSGTEWEFYDAFDAGKAAGVPLLVVYRRMEAPTISMDDPELSDKIKQRQRVKDFFASFVNTDGSIKQGYNQYQKPEDFRREFETHLRKLVARLLETQSKQTFQTKTTTPTKPVATWEGSPFPGLRAFTEKEEPIFFGRGRETDKLVQMVEQSRFVAVVGASGSGKSSLVGAGLIPRLRENSIDGSRDWYIVRCTPGEKPFLNLSEALIGTIPALAGDPIEIATRAEMLAKILQDASENLNKTISHALQEDVDWSQVLLFIDQFEELLTLTTVEVSKLFGKILTNLSGKIRVVVTLRADFYHRMLPLLEEPLRDGSFTLAKPSPIALYEMIVRPAERAGIVFEDGLAERIVRDTGDEPGALALMAYLLDELYNVDDDKVLTHKEYEDLGGVAQAIGTRAENVFLQLDGDEAENEKTLFRVFRELVEVDENGTATRRRISFNPDKEGEAVRDLIYAFVDARLLMTSQVADGATVEVAHEALLREWGRLSEWIDSAKDDLRLLRQVHSAFDIWKENGKLDTLVWSAERLVAVYDALQNLGVKPESEFQRFIRHPEYLASCLEAKPTKYINMSKLEIWEWLSLTYDPRPGISNTLEGIPDIEWCVVTSTLSMSKYLISNIQYRSFVDSAGYDNSQYWTSEGWEAKEYYQWREPLSWLDNSGIHDNYPVQGISWYEAQAFCNWLSESLTYEVFLPTIDILSEVFEAQISANTPILFPAKICEWTLTKQFTAYRLYDGETQRWDYPLTRIKTHALRIVKKG